jgi:hypothetical protein
VTEERWQASAACKGVEAEFFFDKSNLFEIRKRCIGCPVFEECFAWSTSPITYDEVPFGIIAGYTQDQRMAIASRRYIKDWREDFGEYYRDRDGKLRRSRNKTTPAMEVRAPAVTYGELQLLQRAAERPQCPDCDTGIDVHKQKRNAAGQQVWRHLRCGRYFIEEEAVA